MNTDLENNKELDELLLKAEWFKEAKEQTMDTLPSFLNKLLEREHDYGTICRAIAAGAVGTMNAMNRHKNGGITGFQASCIMWDVIDGWGVWDKGPKRMVTYNDCLYPQYERKFTSIPRTTWKWLQEKAKEKLSEGNTMHERVKAHMESIVKGIVPFGLTIDESEI